MNKRTLAQVLECPRLPSLPAVAVQIIDLCRQDHAGVADIGQVLSHDPALSAKVLQTINSSLYGMRQRISSVERAVVMLGLNTVKMLSLGFGLLPILKDAAGKDYDPLPLFRRSLYAATAARTIAKQVGIAEYEEAFLGALLEDLGVFALLQYLHTPYVQLLQQAGPRHSRLCQLEQRQLDLDHPSVGAALAEKWLFPQWLIEVIRSHEDPSSAPPPRRPLLQAVALGAKVADCFLTLGGQSEVDDYLSAAQRWFALDPKANQQLLETTYAGTRELSRFFDIPTGAVRGPDEILVQANELLLQLSLNASQNVSALQERNRQLRRQSDTDPLTGLANRRFLDAYLDHLSHVGDHKPVSLIFLDVDHFKQINDTFGHHAGDQVLVQLARLLEETVPPNGLVSRYGGEEFLLVMATCTLACAAALAEKLRLAVAAAPLAQAGDRPVAVTISLGVVCAEKGLTPDTVLAYLQAADAATYAAKKQGRNCVRTLALQNRRTDQIPSRSVGD
ncbi:MAG: GGDEF domain-containing protein [Phycisphaeraceae bacterium]|nr:GGDEF domain-containing protein [Phycisphaeraceae bacterium]